jgi:hypothetical protein
MDAWAEASFLKVGEGRVVIRRVRSWPKGHDPLHSQPWWEGCDSIGALKRDRCGLRERSVYTRIGIVAVIVCLVVVAIVSVVGYVIIATGSKIGGRSFVVVVRNDGTKLVMLQPCERYECELFRAVRLPSGQAYSVRTTDGDAGVHTFFVARADGREIGCLGQHGLANFSRIVLKVSALEECVT